MIAVLNGLIEKARNNPDYVGAVATGYLFIVLNIVLQIVLVPLYLAKLGPYRFGILMMLLSFVNFTTIGIYGFTSSALRVLGEHAAADSPGFARAYGLARTLLVGYGALLALLVLIGGIGFERHVFGAADARSRYDIEGAVALLALYVVLFLEFGLNRVALFAVKRQTQANAFHILSYVVFGASAIPWLLSGGGLTGVVGCLVGGVVAARAASALYGRRGGLGTALWIWPSRDLRPLLTRFVGTVGGAYFAYGVLFVLLQTDVLVVGWLADPTTAGRYVLVWKIAEVIVLMLWRVPEHLQPEFIRMDARGEHERLARVYRHAFALVRLASLAAAVGYALLGPWLVRLWVGPAHAPSGRWGFILAGAAIFWLGMARMPAVLAYALMRLKPLLRVAAVEVGGKLVLIFLLFPYVGYLAPLIAINAVHLCGVSLAYVRLAGRRIKEP